MMRAKSEARRRRRRWSSPAPVARDCIAPSRLEGLRGSIPRWFISCRNAGPTLVSSPLSRSPVRSSSFGSRDESRQPGVVSPRSCPPRNSGNSNGGCFTQSTVPGDFHEIPVLDTFALCSTVAVVPPLSLRLSLLQAKRHRGAKVLILGCSLRFVFSLSWFVHLSTCRRYDSKFSGRKGGTIRGSRNVESSKCSTINCAQAFNHLRLATGSRTVTSDRTVCNNSSLSFPLELIGVISLDRNY